MTNKHVMAVASGVCGATLLFAFGGTAYGHDDDGSRTDKPLVWVDSKGKTIGRAVGTQTFFSTSWVQIRIDGLSLIVPLRNRSVCPPGTCLEVTWGGGDAVVFSGENCMGTAYLLSAQPGSARAVGVRGKTLFYGANSATSVASFASQTTPTGECVNFGGTGPVWTVAKTVNLYALPFTPPFYLK